MSMWPTSDENPGHQGSGERPWWVKLRACHTSLPGGLNAVHVTPLGETMEAGPGLSLPRLPLPFTDFNLYPFSVINRNHESNGFAKF